MEIMTGCGSRKCPAYNDKFLEFIKLFDAIGKDERLFPKKCSTCGRVYESFSEYLWATMPRGHALEDVTNVMHSPFTMQYRNCSCGSTLVLSLTEEIYPELERFWKMLKDEAEETGKPLKQVVSEFREQCSRYVVERMLAEEEGSTI